MLCRKQIFARASLRKKKKKKMEVVKYENGHYKSNNRRDKYNNFDFYERTSKAHE